MALDVAGALSTSGDVTVTGTSKIGIGTDTLDAVLFDRILFAAAMQKVSMASKFFSKWYNV